MHGARDTSYGRSKIDYDILVEQYNYLGHSTDVYHARTVTQLLSSTGNFLNSLRSRSRSEDELVETRLFSLSCPFTSPIRVQLD